MANSTAISQGAKNSTPEDILRKHLSPALKGNGWNSLISAIATGDAYIQETAQSAFEQLFKSTASGIYLNRIASNDGFSRPPEIGMSDDIFRKLAIKITSYKQITQVILETLESYYGSDCTRAFNVSSVEEPYNLSHNQQLFIKIDNERTVIVTFQEDDFQQISSAKALEVVARINRAFSLNNSTGYAISYKDPAQNKTFIKIFSGSLGLSGAVSIHGGEAQNVFKFPTPVHPISSDGPQIGTQFNILGGTGINGVPAGRVRFTFTGGADPDLVEVQVGDYANVFGAIFPASLRNSYKVLDVTTTSIELEDNNLTWPSSVTITTLNDLKFFRPTLLTIQSMPHMATAFQGEAGILEILLLATTQAVSRKENTAAYLHVAPSLSVSSGSRNLNGAVTINTSSSHGVSANDWVYIDNLVPSNTIAYSTEWIDDDPDVIVGGIGYGQAVVLPNGNVLFAGGYDGAASNKAFIYNVSTLAWTRVADMNTARYKFQMALLNTGKVLVTGGVGLSSSELYDYNTDTWTTTGATPSNRSDAPCLTLKDGRVMLISGDGTGSVIAYDPITGTWSSLADITASGIPTSFNGAAAVLLPDGRVVVGGGDGTVRPTTYNPITNSWRESDSIFNSTSFLMYLKAIYLPIGQSGKVLFTGGCDSGFPNYESACYLFDPSTQRLTTIDSLSIGRCDHGIAILKNGDVIVMGGQIADDLSATNTSEILDISTLKWSLGPSLPNEKEGFPTIKLFNNRIMAIGGVNEFTTTYYGSSTYTDYNSILAAGGLNGLYQVVTTPSATSFTYSTPDFKYPTTLMPSGTITPIKTPTNAIHGPFIYEIEGPAITGITTTLNQEVVMGNNYNTISVADSSKFPDEQGYLVFGFGTSISTFPVKYLSRISGTSLLIDPSFVFPKTLPIGTTITLLKNRGPLKLEHPESTGNFYLTASSAGRVAASDTTDKLVALGITLKKTIMYPGDIGLGNAGYPVSGSNKLSDKIVVWGSDSIDDEIAKARGS